MKLLSKPFLGLRMVLAAISLLSIAASTKAQDSLFAPPVNYGAGYGPMSVFAADLDGDSDYDLAVANSNSDNVSILKNNGDGTFQTAANYGAGDYPTSVFAADLDGDGDYDLAVTIYGSAIVSILLNNNDGTFAPAVNYGAGDLPLSVFSADFDGDSDFDLVVANAWSTYVSVLLNNGDGTFAAAINYGAGFGPHAVFSADLNGDSAFDLTVANRFSNFVSILLNNGDGTFAVAINYGASDNPKAVFSADLNGDNAFDLAVANAGSDNVSILLNDGDGTFAAAVNYGAGDQPESIFSADFDGDSDFDLGVANHWSDNVAILLNNGDGTFQTAVNYGAGEGPYSVFAADLDGDSDYDLAVANFYSDNVSILINMSLQPPFPPELILKDIYDQAIPEGTTFGVYRVENNPPEMTEHYRGLLSTQPQGRLVLPEDWFSEGDSIKISIFLHSEPAKRHTSILPYMYNVYLDNAKFDLETGAIIYDELRPGATAQVILDHTTIAYDLLVSVEWDAEQSYLDSLAVGFKHLSNYLYDVFDGQVVLQKVYIYDNKENWSEADIRVFANNVQQAQEIGNIKDDWYWNSYIRMPRAWYGDTVASMNLSAVDNWDYILSQPTEYRTIAHEMGHYVFGFDEEYLVLPDWNCLTVHCDSIINFGFMDNHYENCGVPFNTEMSSEYHYSDVLCRITPQYANLGVSCWGYFEDTLERSEGYGGIFCPIKTPSEGNTTPGETYFEGPNNDDVAPWFDSINYDVSNLLYVGIDNNETGARTVAGTCRDIANNPIPGAEIWQRMPLDHIKQGRTADSMDYFGTQYKGRIRVLGYHTGDWIQAGLGYWVDLKGNGEFKWHYGQATGVDDSVSIILKAVQGNYRMIYYMYWQSAQLYFIVNPGQMFSDNPILEIYPDGLSSYTYELQYSADAYMANLTDSIGLYGVIRLLAPDDSGNVFFVNSDYGVVTSSGSSQISFSPSPDGLCNLLIDTVNAEIERVVVVSSPYPPMRAGLDDGAQLIGNIYAFSSDPSTVLSGTNTLSIHFEADDFGDDSQTFSLEIVQFDTVTDAWQLLGGTVDTVRNLVHANINGFGIFGLSASVLFVCGDIDGSGGVNVADLTYLVDYLFRSGPEPPVMDAANVDGQGGVNVADVTYIVNYLFRSGPPPVC